MMVGVGETGTERERREATGRESVAMMIVGGGVQREGVMIGVGCAVGVMTVTGAGGMEAEIAGMAGGTIEEVEGQVEAIVSELIEGTEIGIRTGIEIEAGIGHRVAAVEVQGGHPPVAEGAGVQRGEEAGPKAQRDGTGDGAAGSCACFWMYACLCFCILVFGFWLYGLLYVV